MCAKTDTLRLRAPELAIHRSAVIDIGSNSVRLVVYEGPPRAPAVIFNEKVPAGLGRGLSSDGRIAPEDAERGLIALRRYALLAQHMEVEDLQCVATAAVRDATNGADFIAGAAEAGLTIRLLSGEEEALAAGCGVLSAIPDAHGIAVDLGGGSLELAEVAAQFGRFQNAAELIDVLADGDDALVGDAQFPQLLFGRGKRPLLGKRPKMDFVQDQVIDPHACPFVIRPLE